MRSEPEEERLQQLAWQVTDLLNALPDDLLAGGAGVLIGTAVAALLSDGGLTLQQVHDLVDSLAALHTQVTDTPAARDSN